MIKFIAAQIRIGKCGGQLYKALHVRCRACSSLKRLIFDLREIRHIAASSPGQPRLLPLAPPVDQLRLFKYRSSCLLHHTDYTLALSIYTAHRAPR